MSRVAVTSRSFSQHPELRARLLARHPDTTFNDAGGSLRGGALIDFLHGHDKAITALEPLTDDLFSALPDLKVIAKFGVGLDMVDLAAMRRHGVRLGWTGGVNRRAVSELTIGMMIALLRHVPRGHDQVRAGGWTVLKGRQLSERAVGIIGCGHIGKDLAVLLRAFGCAVLAHDIKDFPDFYRHHDITPLGLEELLARADIVTLHLPLDASTRGILSARRLALMKPDAILINCARGGLVDEVAVKAMLMEGRLAAAGFDVFDGESPRDLELVRLPSVLTTPHIGGSSEEGILAMGMAAIEGLESATVPEPCDHAAGTG